MTTLYTTKTPMSEARRNHIHGPLVSDLPPLRPIRELLAGAGVIALFCLVMLGFAVVTP